MLTRPRATRRKFIVFFPLKEGGFEKSSLPAGCWTRLDPAGPSVASSTAATASLTLSPKPFLHEGAMEAHWATWHHHTDYSPFMRPGAAGGGAACRVPLYNFCRRCQRY